MKSRNWTFTLNNPSGPEVNKLLEADNIKFLCASLECGQNQTLHYQGYLELTTARAWSYLRSLSNRAHWEHRRGSRKQAIEYTMKTFDLKAMSNVLASTAYGMKYRSNGGTGGLPLSSLPQWICIGYNGTFGELEESLSPKKKTPLADRLIAIQDRIANGATETEISEDHFVEWCRYRHAFRDYRLLHQKPRMHQMEIIVIQGPTGTGKSRFCAEEYPDAYWKSRDTWWCGYQQQDTVIIDEFYGWMPYDFLLRLCDRYPLDVEVKGGKTCFNSKRIIFTSNKIPSTWYPNIEYFKAFIRRVSKWMVFGTVFRSVYTDYTAAKFIDLHNEDQLGDINNQLH